MSQQDLGKLVHAFIFSLLFYKALNVSDLLLRCEPSRPLRRSASTLRFYCVYNFQFIFVCLCFYLVIKASNVRRWPLLSFFEFQSNWTVCCPVQESQDPSQRTEGFLPQWLGRAKRAAWAESEWALEPHIRGESGEAVSRRSVHPSPVIITDPSAVIDRERQTISKHRCCEMWLWSLFQYKIKVNVYRNGLQGQATFKAMQLLFFFS